MKDGFIIKRLCIDSAGLQSEHIYVVSDGWSKENLNCQLSLSPSEPTNLLAVMNLKWNKEDPL